MSAVPPEQGPAPPEDAQSPQVQVLGMTQEQFEIFRNQSNRNGRPKAREPDVFSGDRTKLRNFLAQMEGYFRVKGYSANEDTIKVAYGESLLRGSAESWILNYIEGSIEREWNTWEEFKTILKQQFGDVNAQETARQKMESMKQGQKNMTEFWNEFRLLATEARYDDATLWRTLLAACNSRIQNAWAQGDTNFTTTNAFAIWAIEKENKLNLIQHVQGKHQWTRQQELPRNSNGTYKPKIQQKTENTPSYDEPTPMDLDTAGRKPNRSRFPRLSPAEFQKRRDEKRCWKCGLKGHFATNCFKKNISIKETTTEPQDQETLNEESPQQ